MPTHIVLIGSDASVFSAEAETRQRLLSYARCVPDGHVTYFCLPANAPAFVQDNFSAESLGTGRLSSRARLYRRLLALHRDRPLHLISTQNLYEECWVSLLVKWRLKTVAVVGQEHNDPFDPGNFGTSWLKKLRHAFSMKLLRFLDGIRTVSPAVAEKLKQLAPHVPLAVIPVPVSLQPLPRSEDPAHPRLLYVGRLSPQKNVEGWLDVAAAVAKAVPGSTFHIVGDGPLRASLETKSNGLAVFHGQISYSQLAQHFASASVLLVPSWYEGFGRVVLEALICGTPVVASRTAGPRSMLEGTEAGLLFDPGDTDGMAKAVTDLLQDPARRDRMREHAASVVRRFSPETLRREWIDFLLAAARKRR